jgi:pyruvate dehydrogenase E1 component beta subunit
MRTLQVREALREALRQELEADPSVFVFGEDVAGYGGLDAVTAGLQKEFGPERVFDTPIAESGMAGLAVGAAMMGMRPVVEMQFTGLITVALDQIANSAAKARYVHQGGLTVPMVVRTINFGKGNVYVAQALEAWVAHVPGLKVVAPSTPADSKGLMIASIRDPDPVVFVEHVSLYGREGPVPEEPYTVPLGKASVTRQGSDVTVVTYLSNVPIAEEAADELAAESISVEVVDLRTLVPFDRETVLSSVSKTGRLVVAHEAVRRAGFGAEIVAVVTESEAFRDLKAPVVRVANEGVPVPHSHHLYPHVLPDKDDVIAGIRRALD